MNVPAPLTRPLHLRPCAELAERVLLPGDPHRALAVAQALTDGPRMFNHARGLWGYTGIARDGAPLTIQATGIGGPSAAVVCEELIALGARRLVRIGTCGVLGSGIEAGEILAAETVLPADGTSSALGASAPLRPAQGMLQAAVAAGARPAPVVSSDLFYDPREHKLATWAGQGAVAVDGQAAAVLQVSARHGVAAACVLGVTGPAGDPARRLAGVDELELLGVRVGELGLRALAGGGPEEARTR